MSEQNPIREKIVARAVKDGAFRQELLSDPKAVVARELGVTLPAEANIEVLEDTTTTLHIVLPPKNLHADDIRELSDADLEAVAGGSFIILWTLYCEFD